MAKSGEKWTRIGCALGLSAKFPVATRKDGTRKMGLSGAGVMAFLRNAITLMEAGLEAPRGLICEW